MEGPPSVPPGVDGSMWRIALRFLLYDPAKALGALAGVVLSETSNANQLRPFDTGGMWAVASVRIEPAGGGGAAGPGGAP